MSNPQPIAVIDLGKTNMKMFVIKNTGEIIDQYQTNPVWKVDDGITVLDHETILEWAKLHLHRVHKDHDVSGVMISGHGCTFALIDDDGLVLPMLDYEQSPPAELDDIINAAIPEYYHTYSPPLPLGLNFSRHVIWREEAEPEAFARAQTMLTYPQYFSWALSGVRASEVSYFGCHTDLWAPKEDDFSSLVKARHWERLMAPFHRAGAVLGAYVTPTGSIAVHNGVHDSNAAYYYYQSLGYEDFTLVSTGTWVVIFNAACSVEALDPHRDMLANITVNRKIAPTIRFMGGREFDLVSGGVQSSVSKDGLQDVINKGIFVLPSFEAGGPMPDFEGGFIGPKPQGDERAAAALLYVALMTDLSLDLIQSNNDIIIDGGLTKSENYARLLGQFRPEQTILTTPVSQGSALGAAALAFEANGESQFSGNVQTQTALQLDGLDSYKKRWRDIVDQAWKDKTYNIQDKITTLAEMD